MDRKQLHALIDQAIDAIGCDECRETFLDHVAQHACQLVGEHTVQKLGNDLRDGKLTAAQAYDCLAEVMHPIYRTAGDEIPPELNKRIRAAFLGVASRGLN